MQNNPLNNTDPSGFDCMGSSECGYAYSQQAIAGAMAVAAATQAQLRAADPGSATGAYTAGQIAGLSNAASNSAGADVQAQHQAQMAEQANQASARAMEQAKAQNRTNQDAQRAFDAAFTHPDSTPLPSPETGNGLYYGPSMGPNWSGYLADNRPTRIVGTECNSDSGCNRSLPILPAIGDLVRAGIEAGEVLSRAWGLLFQKPLTPNELLKPGGKLIGEAGASSDIRVLPGGRDAAWKMFVDLSRGGDAISKPTYPGTMIQLPNGSTVGIREIATATLSRAPPAMTIDVNIPGVAIRELKFVP